jgi:DNA phosphorothioation-dependent restriction protein DptG
MDEKEIVEFEENFDDEENFEDMTWDDLDDGMACVDSYNEIENWGDLMDEKEIKEFVENFKGMTWDDLDDGMAGMDIEDLKSVIRELKVRFG